VVTRSDEMWAQSAVRKVVGKRLQPVKQKNQAIG
jgi:hypothetical protein